jgi:hypothetical protein
VEFGDRASEANQARYFEELEGVGDRRTDTTVFFFEAFDEPWKGDPGEPPGCREALGPLSTSTARPKKVMRREPGGRDGDR